MSDSPLNFNSIRLYFIVWVFVSGREYLKTSGILHRLDIHQCVEIGSFRPSDLSLPPILRVHDTEKS